MTRSPTASPATSLVLMMCPHPSACYATQATIMSSKGNIGHCKGASRSRVLREFMVYPEKSCLTLDISIFPCTDRVLRAQRKGPPHTTIRRFRKDLLFPIHVLLSKTILKRTIMKSFLADPKKLVRIFSLEQLHCHSKRREGSGLMRTKNSRDSNSIFPKKSAYNIEH